MNAQALTVINRIAKKLTGRDFSKDETLDVPAQVHKYYNFNLFLYFCVFKEVLVHINYTFSYIGLN